LAAAGTTFAQSTVTISGGISAGILDSGKAGTTQAVSSLGGGANAINIVTTEDLGGGLKGGFSSQIRFSGASGDVTSAGAGNALFHDANVYVSGGFGTVRVGKIAEASPCAFDPWGCTGGAAMVAGLGVGGNAATGGSGLIGAGSQQQSVSFATPTISGFSASIQTSVMSANSPVSTTALRANERRVVTLNYAKGPLSAQVLRTDNGANAGGNGSSYNTGVGNNLDWTTGDTKGNATSIAASYDLGVAKVNLQNAVTKSAAGAKSNDIMMVSASIPMGAITLLAGYAKDKAAVANMDTKFAVGANYALSKRTTIGADMFKAEQGANTGTGFTLRARHTF